MAGAGAPLTTAVIFDMDGVLVDSEHLWDEARRALVAEAGGAWKAEATRAMMGMSAPEWSAYMRDDLGVARDAEAIDADVLRRMEEGYRRDLPLIEGAVEAVRGAAGRWPLGLASSSNRPLIDLALREAGVEACFAAVVSSEEVARGKPAPDVYRECARRLDFDPRACIAIEDSSNGIRSAHAAGMAIVAVPNDRFPPDRDALALAAVTVGSVREVTVDLLASLR